ncbi:MAG: DUF302 domain-containing protein [Gemmatimonadetes bacterium]|nr:DUF302 domain-containing protein [Gemmatimonadota bacterium]
MTSGRPPADLPLSDVLALGRTSLANERTLLAYLRTALQCVVGGVSLMKYFDHPFTRLLGAVFLPLGLSVGVAGVVLFARRQWSVRQDGGSAAVLFLPGGARFAPPEPSPDPGGTPMATPAEIVTLSTPYPPGETLDRLAALALQRGMTVFARIEFSRDAAAAGLTLPPMAQLVFGNPLSGTPVLAAAPGAGLDLPLRALAWTDGEGKSWLSYADPRTLAAKHGLPEAVLAPLQGIHALAHAAVEKP